MTSCSLQMRMAFVAALLWLGCSASPRFAERGDRGKEPSPPPGARTPPEGKVLLSVEGVASFYADDFHGHPTSNGETYDMHAFTAAHRTFPFGTAVRVTNLDNGKTVIVRVNDRGPFKEGRLIDLSFSAAKALGLVATGTARVRLDVLEWGTGK